MNQISRTLAFLSAWIQGTFDSRDVVAAAALWLVYDGVSTVFGVGWARLVIGTAVLAVYALVEFNSLIRSKRGGVTR